ADLLRDFDEFEVRPTTPWNYALAIDRDRPEIEVWTSAVSDVPFANEAPPVVLRVKARRLPGWGMRPTPGTVVLGRVDGGWQQLQATGAPLPPDVPHRLRVDVRGPQLRTFVNDMNNPVLVSNDDTFARGGVGLRAYRSEAAFEDIRINDRPVAATGE